jgi:hypothetical protein
MIKKNYRITPSLAFIYQLLNKDNFSYLPDEYKTVATNFDRQFSYEDAIDCCSDLKNPKWENVQLLLEIIGKVIQKKVLNFDHEKYDNDFLLDILKNEVIEMKKGYMTVIHSKSSGFLVFDIISQLISGSNEGYKWKCQRNENDPDQKAIYIYDELKFNYEDEDTSRDDHTPEIRARLIAGNLSIFNNLFIKGESTLLFYFGEGSIAFPSFLIEDLNLSRGTILSIIRLSNKINKLSENIISIYSFPFDKMDTYLYPSKAFGFYLNIWKDFYDYYNSFLSDEPWLGLFKTFYTSQVRITDLCYTKYAYEDGVRVKQYVNTSKEELDKYLIEIEKIVLSDKDLVEKITQKIDISKKRLKNPLESIVPRDKDKNIKPKIQKQKWQKYTQDLAHLLSSDNEPIPYLEKKIVKSQSEKMAKIYMEDILKKRWSEGEEIIWRSNLKNRAYDLVVPKAFLLNQRIPEIEKILFDDVYPLSKKKKSDLLFQYTDKFWKDKDDPELWNLFFKYHTPTDKLIDFIEKFDASTDRLDQIILNSGNVELLEMYTRVGKGKRWPEAEQIIMKEPNYGVIYAIYQIGKRWPEMEPYLYKYRKSSDTIENLEMYLDEFKISEEDLFKKFPPSPSRKMTK